LRSAQARINKLSQPMKKHRRMLVDTFVSAALDVLKRVVDAGLYTSNEVKQMPREEFYAMVKEHDYDGDANRAADALDAAYGTQQWR